MRIMTRTAYEMLIAAIVSNVAGYGTLGVVVL